MKRMNLYKFICYCCLIWGAMACTKEDTPEATWEYTGPVPAIPNGPAEAQKMCYALYQKYDLHVYYNLSGDDALRTEVGYAQINGITANNPAAIPMQAANETVAEKFLTLLSGFFDLLPDQMVNSNLYRRHVLVKINPGYNKYKDENGDRIFSNTKPEEMQGIIYYGYLDNDQDTDDKFTNNLKGWKWGIFYEFFRGLAFTTYKGIPLPERFGAISKGLYYSENETGEDVCLDYSNNYNREIGKKCGFVSPFGASASSKYPYTDWGSFVAWILTEDLTERDADMKRWPRLQEKYNLVMQYYRQYYELDLEQLAEQCQKLTIK